MKIDPRQGNLWAKIIGENEAAKGGEKSRDSQKAQGEDVSLSRLAEMVRRAAAEKNEITPERAEKLAALAEKIAQGEYRPNAEAIAEAMLEGDGEGNER